MFVPFSVSIARRDWRARLMLGGDDTRGQNGAQCDFD
jgi:hypothetical protein